MEPMRILVFSATYGAGHVKAAEALIAALRMKEPSAEIIHEDAIELISKGGGGSYDVEKQFDKRILDASNTANKFILWASRSRQRKCLFTCYCLGSTYSFY